MANIIQPLPTKAGAIGDLARQLLRLLGPAYPAPDDSLNAADALRQRGATAERDEGARIDTVVGWPPTATRVTPAWSSPRPAPATASSMARRWVHTSPT